jgi:hypothetical protein
LVLAGGYWFRRAASSARWAIGEAAEGLAGRDAAALQELGGLDLPDLGDREQDLEDFRGL